MNTILSGLGDKIIYKIFRVDIDIPQDSLAVIVRNRDKVLFRSMVESLSSTNLKGNFDVLPQHGNFITLIQDKIKIRRNGVSDTEIPVGTGVLRVWRNQVEVYLDVA